MGAVLPWFQLVPGVASGWYGTASALPPGKKIRKIASELRKRFVQPKGRLNAPKGSAPVTDIIVTNLLD